MGHAYAGIAPLPTPRHCPPGWPSGWSCPGGPNPWPPGWPPTNGTTPTQWPETWPYNDDTFSGDYSVWIVMPSEAEHVSDGEDFSIGVITLDHTGSSTAVYNGTETVTVSESGSSDGTLAFNNGTTITRSSAAYGGILDQVNYTISGGDSETFNLKASVSISGTEYTDVATLTAVKNYIDISCDDVALDAASGSLGDDTEDFILTLTIKDSAGSTVTGYSGSVDLKYFVDPRGTYPNEPTLYIYGVDGNSSYSDGTATSVAATQSGPYSIPSSLWASGTDGVVTIKCRYNSYFTNWSDSDTIVFRGEVTS